MTVKFLFLPTTQSRVMGTEHPYLRALASAFVWFVDNEHLPLITQATAGSPARCFWSGARRILIVGLHLVYSVIY
jgi:hypothetical protein